MGYYSEVALTMKTADVAELMRRAKAECEDVFDFLEIANMHTHGSEYTTLHWDCVKWNDTDLPYSYIGDFYKNTDEYHFIRCGEESGDIEENYSDVCDAVLQFTCPVTTIEIY